MPAGPLRWRKDDWARDSSIQIARGPRRCGFVLRRGCTQRRTHHHRRPWADYWGSGRCRISDRWGWALCLSATLSVSLSLFMSLSLPLSLSLSLSRLSVGSCTRVLSAGDAYFLLFTAPHQRHLDDKQGQSNNKNNGWVFLMFVFFLFLLLFWSIGYYCMWVWTKKKKSWLAAATDIASFSLSVLAVDNRREEKRKGETLSFHAVAPGARRLRIINALMKSFFIAFVDLDEHKKIDNRIDPLTGKNCNRKPHPKGHCPFCDKKVKWNGVQREKEQEKESNRGNACKCNAPDFLPLANGKEGKKARTENEK